MSSVRVEVGGTDQVSSPASQQHASACPLYLSVGDVSVLVHLHPAEGAGPAVLLCPPFGGRDINSYRSRFVWAERLAAAGMPALRLDLPGTGDSTGSVKDPACLDNWVSAVDAGVRFLRVETQRPRVAVIGIGLGGLAALAAIAGGSTVDDLVLWGVPARGRSLVRELATFTRMEAEAIVAAGAPEPPELQPDEIAPGGFVLPAETIRSLESLHFTDLRLAEPRTRRALLLGRDGISPDTELRRQLEDAGIRVDVADGQGFGDMMTVFHEAAHLPEGVRERVEHWLLSGDRGGSAWQLPLPSRPSTSLVAEFSVGDARVRETPVDVTHEEGRLSGILSEAVDAPPAGPMLVFLNAGAMRRVGPCRLWVEVGRRWAARGVPSLRIDLDGIGDSSGAVDGRLDEDDLYAEAYLGQIRATLDHLVARGARRFALLGLCSGAYWAFQTALVDDRVSLALMLNPRLLFWSPETQAEIKVEVREQVNSHNRHSQLFRIDAWGRVLSGGGRDAAGRLLALGGATAAEPFRGVARARARHVRRARIAEAFSRVRIHGGRLAMIFCGGEPLRDDLAAVGIVSRLSRWPYVELIDVPGRDHILRPLWMHEHVHSAVDRVLAGEIQRMSEIAPG